MKKTFLNLIYPNRPRKHGDRYDSFRLRNVAPFFAVIPHIMRNRTGSMVFFEERVEIDSLEQFARRMRAETGMEHLSVIHIVMAALVRVLALHPGLNRYVSGRRLYARNHISLSIAVKSAMNEAGAETTVKTLFAPTDSLEEVWKKLCDNFESVKESEQNNGTYRAAEILKHMPVLCLRFFVFLMRELDTAGLMPKAIYRVSPFHASAFVVDIGSTGIDSIYHHLYDFGNCPVFVSVGRKENILKMDSKGNLKKIRTINFKFVVDERICDGFYYAKAMCRLRRILRHPEILLTPLSYPVPDPLLVRERKK